MKKLVPLMRSHIASILISLSMFPYSAHSVAEQTASYKCPKTIGFIRDNDEVSSLLPSVKEIYLNLGCKTEFLPFPGKRLVVEFNRGQIDGEFARVPVIEVAYDIDFVRSSVPIISHNAYEWSRDDSGDYHHNLLGYTLGVKWQENHIFENDNARRFISNQEKFDAYNKGVIDQFIETDRTVEIAFRSGALSETPNRRKMLTHLEAFHYLSSEYLAFMAAFDVQLRSSAKFGFHDVKE